MTLDPSKDQPTTDSKILDLSSFRKKKATTEELARGRQPLFSSHLDQPKGMGKRAGQADFGDRLQRIRASLDKINRLMSDLKKMSASDAPGAESTKRPLH